jgi:transcriptional regulator with XRE-family HTH domain
MIDRGLREAGGVSQLARALGVQRTTVQRWRKGTEPSDESVALLRSVLRRVDVPESRLARISTSNRLTVTGRMDGQPRTVHLGRYLAPGTMQKAADAFMRGADPADLHLIVWSGIDNAPGYRWMFQPDGWTQTAPGDRLRASQRAERLAGGGSGGGGGGNVSGGDEGDDLGDQEDDFDEDYDDSDELYDYDDVAYADGDNSGYEFAAASART